MGSLFVRIQFLFPSLPRAEKSFAAALLEHPEAISNMTLAEIARESGSSDASVIRFCKRLGFSGYTELKQACTIALQTEEKYVSESVEDTDTMKDILKKVYNSNLQTLNDTLVLANSDAYDAALNVLLKANSIHFFGAGDAYAVCSLAMMKFSRLGVNCSTTSDVMLQLTTAGNLTPNDVAIAVSYEGRTKNVVEAMRVAKSKGATTISVTKMNKSPLLKFTDITLFTVVNDLTTGRDKVTRRVADQFILDALYVAYASKQKKNASKHLQEIQKAIDRNKY